VNIHRTNLRFRYVPILLTRSRCVLQNAARTCKKASGKSFCLLRFFGRFSIPVRGPPLPNEGLTIWKDRPR
jgi:hypothetical protein